MLLPFVKLLPLILFKIVIYIVFYLDRHLIVKSRNGWIIWIGNLKHLFIWILRKNFSFNFFNDCQINFAFVLWLCRSDLFIELNKVSLDYWRCLCSVWIIWELNCFTLVSHLIHCHFVLACFFNNLWRLLCLRDFFVLRRINSDWQLWSDLWNNFFCLKMQIDITNIIQTCSSCKWWNNSFKWISNSALLITKRIYWSS